MNRDIIDLQDYTILVEAAEADTPTVDACVFDEPVIAVAFYGEGNVDLTVRYGDKEKHFSYTKGMVLSFYADEQVQFIHTISAGKPLACIVVATAIRNLQHLPNEEGEIFQEMLQELIHPSDHYVEGPQFFMTPAMQPLVQGMFDIPYAGKTRLMFFRSQVTALLSHFFGQLALQQPTTKSGEREKLDLAKDLLTQQLDNPPSLNELARAIGLNTSKLKKQFKAYFGVPVFKYLQKKRLTTAHSLIQGQQLSIQEAAWKVGYDSLSSFSNAFKKHFGYRPSQVK